MASPSAANVCLPTESCPVIVSVPPVPSATRGVRCPLDGDAGKFNAGRPVLVYCSGRLVVARTVNSDGRGQAESPPLLPDISPLSVLCYRGHASANATACKLSPSGYYMVSGDEKGGIKVWAFDSSEHLSKYDNASCLKGAVRDVDWDMESKRLAIVGERMDARSECAKAIQWDGVTAGTLSQFSKGRVASCAFKPNRPFRIVTSGMDEAKCYFHSGPPFTKIPSKDNVPAESAHATRGGVQCVRYSHNGALAASVASDRALCIYDGKTFALITKLDDIHKATVYCCAWNKDDTQLLTCSGDGTCKLFSVGSDGKEVKETKTWNPVRVQANGKDFTKVPVGGTQLGCTFLEGTVPVSVGYNGQISVLNDSDSATEIITGHYAPVDDMTVDYKNNVFYTGDTNGILVKYDLTTTQPLNRIVPSEGDNADLMYVVHGTADRPAAISGVAVMPDSGSLLSVGWDDQLYVTDKSGAVGITPTPLGAQPIAISAGTKLAAVLTVKGVVLVDGAGKITSSGIIEFPYDAKSVCVSKDDKSVYVGGNNCNIYIYSTDGTTLKQTSIIEGKHLKPVHALALSNDNSKLASGDERDVCVFDLKSDNKTLVGRGSWCFHLQRITCLAWSLDDKIVASGGADDSIYLWCLDKKMKRVHYPFAHRGGLSSLAFAKDRELISVGADSVVNRWDVAKDVTEKFA